MIPGDKEGRCFICGRRTRTEVHHCLHGSYRKQADIYGLTVHLCRDCHAALHDRGTYDKELQRLAQEAFEDQYGHDIWARAFGRNFT